MASTKVTFVTGTAEVRRKDPKRESYTSQPPTEQRLTTEHSTPLQVTYVDGKCTCCPYGFHIDLDFLNFCRDLEKGSTLKNLKRIQRTKRKLRKSMEMMLDEQEGIAADPNSAPPDVVHSTEAGRLLHMINYERSATHNILHHIDSAVGHVNERGAGHRYMSSDSEDSNPAYTPGAAYPLDESNRMTTSYSTLDRSDSFGSLSSVSTASNETPLLHLAELQQQQLYHHSIKTKKTKKVVENPVLEMGTAEMKHYSTTSSAQLAANEAPEPFIRPSVEITPATPIKSPATTSSSPRSPADVNQMSLQAIQEAMAVSLQRTRELEEQVKTIPILQVRISVLKEEKRLLNLQLKASKASARPLTSSVGVGDGRVDVVEKMEHSVRSPQTLEFPKSYFTDASSSPQKSPLGKSPPLTLPKPVRTFSVGVGDHSVIEPYNLQPDLPTGYTIQDNETSYEIHSRTVLEESSVLLNRANIPSLNLSFQHSPSFDTVNREKTSATLHTAPESSQPVFTINQIQRSTPKALTRTVGIGDGNVFEDSGLHVHEKELRTIIIGQNTPVAKRNVGIECRVPTRDVGVLFMCDEAKPETRTVGVNVSYDTSDILTSFDFKGETQLRLALRDVLQRNVRSVGTNCNFKPASVEVGTLTNQGTGINVACGDEDNRVDVEIKAATVKKSVAVAAKPETVHKYVGTEPGWVLDAGTNTYQVDTYHKSVMTDKQKQMFASTNTEAVSSHLAACQTEHNMFMNLDQFRHTASNTEQVRTYSTGMLTDIVPSFTVGVNTTENIVPTFTVGVNTIENIVPTFTVGVNTIENIVPTFTVGVNTTETISDLTEKVSDIFQSSGEQKTVVKTKELKSILKKPKSKDSSAADKTDGVRTFSETIETSRKVKGTSPSSQDSTTYNQSEYVTKSSRSNDGKNSFSSFEISSRSAPVTQSFVSNQEELLSKSSIQEELDNRNSPFDRVSPTKSEDRFSETVVEHYVITKDGKKLISEEKMTTSSSGTNRSFKKYSEEEKDPWSRETIQPEITVSHDSDSTQNASISDSYSTSSSGNYSTSSSGSYNSGRINGSTLMERSYASVINNPYMTVENLAEVSSILDSDETLGLPHISKTASDCEIYREKKSSNIEKTSSEELVSEMRRAGSVEDFMPDDIRRYMSIDPSASKDSGFGEDLIQRFSEELSGASAESATSGAGAMRSVKTSKTITTKHTTKSGDKVVVQETKTVSGPDGQVTTVVTETTDGEKMALEGGADSNQHSSALSGQGESDLLTASSTSSSHSSTRVSGQSSSDSNLSFSSRNEESLFADINSSFTGSGTKSFSETTMTAVGDSDEDLTSATGNYGSLDRKSGKLKSIMKRRSSDSQQITSKRGITFAESVIGGTGSSSQEEDNSSDSDSTSFEEGSYDGQQGEVTYYCKDDEAIAQGLPGAQMFDQNIRETYELPSEVREACNVLATYLIDSTSIQTKQLNACQNTVQQEWFQVSSHKLSEAHQVEDFLSSVNEISKRLLEYVINVADANGNTAIHYCVSHCNFEIVSLLLDSEVCNVNKQNKAGFTPIMLAGLVTLQNLEQREVVRRLFSLGNINAKAASTEQTALMLAASHGRTEMVKLLVEEGADVNLQDEDGSTALMCACEHGYLDIVNFLLAQPNIDAQITDNEESTALSIAMAAGHKDVGVVLYKHLNFSKAPSPASHKKRKSSSSPTPSNFNSSSQVLKYACMKKKQPYHSMRHKQPSESTL